MAQVRDSKYFIRVTLEAHTDGKVDGRTIIEEYSEEPTIHLLKQQTFQEEFAKAGVAVGQRMAEAGMALLAGQSSAEKPSKPPRR